MGLELGVSDGVVLLDHDGDPDTSSPRFATFSVKLDQKETEDSDVPDTGRFMFGSEDLRDNLRTQLLGGLFISLPLRASVFGFDIPSDRLGAIELNTKGKEEGLEKLLLFITGAGDAPFTLSVPNLFGIIEELTGRNRSDLTLLNVLNDPSTILDGIDLALSGLEDVMGDSFATDLPLIGDKLAKAATFLRDIRTGVLAELREKLSGNGKAIELIRESLWEVPWS